MTIKELWAKLMGIVTVPDDKKGELDALAAAAEKAFATPTPTPGTQPLGQDLEAVVARAVEAAVAPLKADNAALQKALKDEADARKQATDALLNKQKQDQAAKIEATLKEAIDAGRIPAQAEDQKELWKGLLDKDYDAAKKAIDALPVLKGQGTQQQQQQQQQQRQSSTSTDTTDDKAAALRAAAAEALTPANN